MQEKGEAQCQNIHFDKESSHNTLRNFLCDIRLQQLEVACAKRVSTCTLQIIPAICKCNYFSVKAVILTSSCHVVHQATSKTSEQLAMSFNWPQIFFWTNLKEDVILIRATRKRIFRLLNTMFSCRNRPFPQLIICHKRFQQKLVAKLGSKSWTYAWHHQ